MEPVFSGTVLSGHPVLSGRLSKSQIFPLITVIFASIKRSPLFSGRSHPLLSFKACFHCLYLYWMVTESRNTRTKLRNKKFSIHVSLSKSMQVVFLSKILYIKGSIMARSSVGSFYSIYNLWSQYQAVNLHKAVTLPFPVGNCLIQSQLYCPLSIAVHCLENKRKFLYQWNLLFYNSFL